MGQTAKLRRGVGPGLAAALLLGGCAGGPLGGGQIPPVAVEGARMSPNPLPAELSLPSGPGPHPVVIVLHGCGGLGMNQRVWASRLVGWGYGALVVDSLQPRATASVCAPDRQRLVTRFDRAGDVVAAARWLQTQPGVDGARIAVVGESHGGGTAVTVANKPFVAAEAGLIKATVDYYGPCRDPALYGGMPLLVLAGDDDTWADPARTCSAFRAAVPQGSPVSVVTYPGVVHGFDNSRIVQRRFAEGHPMQYAPEAAADSFSKVHAFLDRTVGPP
jgi:dienelactone hydrolase